MSSKRQADYVSHCITFVICKSLLMYVIYNAKHLCLIKVYSIYSLDEIPVFSLDGVVHVICCHRVCC